jgi:putative oxidoreductase
MNSLIAGIVRLHDRVFSNLERFLDGWFLGLFCRFVFASVLLLYYLNSARTKVGDGLLGFFHVTDSAYYQIALPAVEAAGFDISAVPFLPWGLIVTVGTYSEFLLPVLIVVGLFTRLAALGMIIFIGVQTLVDITVHNVGPETIGTMFDRFPDAAIADQRLLWLVPLVYLVIKGAGAVSLDRAAAAHMMKRRISTVRHSVVQPLSDKQGGAGGAAE